MRPKCNAWEVAARMGRRKKKGAGDKAGGVAKPASAAAVEFAARGASGCKRQSLALGRQRALSLQKILD
jgi:hypothetical protein